MARLKVSASILSADFARLGEEVAAVARDGADAIHVDILDGHFAPNISFGANAVSVSSKFCSLPIEAHLMVLDDLFLTNYLIPEVARAGADTIIIHAEKCLHIDRMLSLIRSLGKRAGIALNPATSVSVIENIMDNLDHILIMSVNPGFSGQNFIDRILAKIYICREMINGRKIELCVDGGVKPDNVAAIGQAGASMIVAASAVFTCGINGSYAKAIEQLRG